MAGVLAETGPARTAALKLRLRERGRPIPGLLRLLRRHSATFSVERGVVSLCDAGVRVARLVKLRVAGIPVTEHGRQGVTGVLADLDTIKMWSQLLNWAKEDRERERERAEKVKHLPMFNYMRNDVLSELCLSQQKQS